jgi:hypothetical protein
MRCLVQRNIFGPHPLARRNKPKKNQEISEKKYDERIQQHVSLP